MKELHAIKKKLPLLFPAMLICDRFAEVKPDIITQVGSRFHIGLFITYGTRIADVRNGPVINN